LLWKVENFLSETAVAFSIAVYDLIMPGSLGTNSTGATLCWFSGSTAFYNEHNHSFLNVDDLTGKLTFVEYEDMIVTSRAMSLKTEH